jgi:large subunit ribosomal protein L21
MTVKYAVVSDRNQQFRAVPGERILIPLRADAAAGAELKFDQVALVAGEGGEPRVGTPFVAGASVSARVIGTVLGPKLIVAKYRRRKASRRRTGSRARFTEIEIQGITA